MDQSPAFPATISAPSPQLPSSLFGSALGQLSSLDSLSELGHNQTASSLGLDALDCFTPLDVPSRTSLGPALVVGGEGLDSLSEFSLPGEWLVPSCSALCFFVVVAVFVVHTQNEMNTGTVPAVQGI